MIEFYIILVENEFSGNAGSVARVMGNYNFDKLVFINPLWNDKTEGLWMSHTPHGKKIFENATYFKNIDDFIEKVRPNIIIGFTRRSGKEREISSNYRDYFNNFFISSKDKLKEIDLKIALLFGKESTGLDDKIIKKCDKLLYIPTNPDSPSLNLSQAVCVILNEIFYLKTITYRDYFLNQSEKINISFNIQINNKIHKNGNKDKNNDNDIKEKDETKDDNNISISNDKNLNNYKNPSNLNFQVESIFKIADEIDKERFFKNIFEAAQKKKLFIRNDVEQFKRLFNRIFTSPFITKRDLNLLEKYLMRFLFAPFKEDCKK